MRTPILSAQVAEDFNLIVQTRIDPRLFLFCSYQPTLSFAISEDGYYADAIQDLYKFTIDTCFLLKNHRDYIPRAYHNTFLPLKEAIERIETLRSVKDHNQNEVNGWLEKERLTSYRNWLMEVLNKPEPTTQGDYQLLNGALKDIAQTVIRQTDLLLNTIANLPNLTNIRRKWYDKTLYWLTHNTRTQLYTSQLIDAYVAKAERRHRRNSDFYQTEDLNTKAKKWIKHSIFYPTEVELEEARKEKEDAQDSLLHPSSIALAVLAKMSPKERQDYEDSLRKRITEADNREKNADDRLTDLMHIYGTTHRECVGHFYAHLEEQLRETIYSLEQEGISYTLLPSDLMQLDIERRFGNIPSPDGDF